MTYQDHDAVQRIDHEALIQLLRASPLFDAGWYQREYPDVADSGMSPEEHYAWVGARLLRDPSSGFSTAFYLQRHADVGDAFERGHLNPLGHYIEAGGIESRRAIRPSGWRRFEPLDGSDPDRLPFAGYIAGRQLHYPERRSVLVCAHFAAPQAFGSERSFLDVVEGLTRLGYNVHVTAPHHDSSAYLDALRAASVTVHDMPQVWWSAERADDQALVALYCELIQRHQIDVVHANTITIREPLLAARRMGIPGIVHVRELIHHDTALCEEIGLPADDIVREVEQLADHVFVNSRATGRAFAPERAQYMPNTCDIATLQSLPPRPEGGPLRVGLVSSNVPKKGIYEFADIARRASAVGLDAEFVIVGPRNEHVDTVLDREEHEAVPARLVFAGYAETPAEALVDLDVVLSVSYFQESFGRTVLEAMAAGRPVIGYDWGAVGELIQDGATGFLVPYGDNARIVEHLSSLAGHPQAMRGMGEAARTLARALFGPEAFDLRLGRAYDRILSLPLAQRDVEVLPRREPISATPLRLAYFLLHFPVPSETFVLNELRLLVEQGVDVEVFCVASPYAEFQPDFPIKWTRVGTPAQLAGALLATGRTMAHSHFVYPTVTDWLWPACEAAEIPFTFIAHAQDIFRYRNDEANRLGVIAKSPWCLRVMAPSRFHMRYFLERGVPQGKLYLSPNGMDPALYREAFATATARDPHAKRSICAVHRFTAKKGLDRLVEAAALLAPHGIDVHIHGYGDEEAALRERAATLASGNVHFHGAVAGRQALMDVFAANDLLICPFVRAADGDMDGVPTVAMEAMASGLPVLATPVSGIPDLIDEGVTGFLCGDTPQAIADAVIAFYEQPRASVEAVIHGALERVSRNYNTRRLVAGMRRLWEGVELDIIIVSWNNLPELREVVRRIQLHTQSRYHLIICDNASAPDVRVFLGTLQAAFDNVTVVFSPENTFVGPGTNTCLAQGTAPVAVYVCGKEGFLFGPGWERAVFDTMDAHPDVGLAGTLCYSPSYLTGAEYPKGVRLFAKFRNQDFALRNPRRRFTHVQGGFFAIRRAMVDEIGGFSEAVPHDYTDVEYSYYAESRGWSLGHVPGMLVLYNRTRPGILSRLDESVLAMHPPTLAQLPLIDALHGSAAVLCHVCEETSDGFAADAMCPHCGATPAERTLTRWLGGSMLTHRQLRSTALAAFTPGMTRVWRQLLNDAELPGADAVIEALGELTFVYVDLPALADEAHNVLSRILVAEAHPEGVLLLRCGEGGSSLDERSIRAMVEARVPAERVRTHRYHSAACGYDSHALIEVLMGGRAVGTLPATTVEPLRLVPAPGWYRASVPTVQGAPRRARIESVHAQGQRRRVDLDAGDALVLRMEPGARWVAAQDADTGSATALQFEPLTEVQAAQHMQQHLALPVARRMRWKAKALATGRDGLYLERLAEEYGQRVLGGDRAQCLLDNGDGARLVSWVTNPELQVIGRHDGRVICVAAGTDPQLHLSGQRLQPGWYRLRMRVEDRDQCICDPWLYLNYGDGYAQRDAVKLPNPDEHGLLEHVFPVLRPATVRFDPTVREGAFELAPIELIRVSRMTAAGEMLKTAFPDGGGWRWFAGQIRRKGRPAASADLHQRYRMATNVLDGEYIDWVRRYDNEGPAARRDWEARYAALAQRPRISVLVPTYNTPPKLLAECIDSVLGQVYQEWELCIADDASPKPDVAKVLKEYTARDPRIKVVLRPQNGHICEATNSALELATGEYIALLDHDDLLRPHALLEMACALAEHPNATLVYSDEDKVGEDDRRRFHPNFKPDFSPDLLYSQNYICHLSVLRTELVRALGGFRKGYEGSQDHDLVLRVTHASREDQIVHVPKVLYHWRAIPGSTALERDSKDYASRAGMLAVQDLVQQIDPAATVEETLPGHYHVIWPLPSPAPRASIIIPTRDRVDLLRVCVESLLSITDYPDLEVLVVDNQSTCADTLAYMREIAQRPNVRVIPYDAPFNYSAINNAAARQATGDLIVLMNNDIEITEAGWLREMTSLAMREGTGCVGARLLYPDGTLQHAGVILGIGGVANHPYSGESINHPGHGGRLRVVQNFSAVTAACLAVRKTTFDAVGGLDEGLAVAFNDIDFCLRVRALGLRNVWTPHATLTHHESASRGTDLDPVKKARFEAEIKFMEHRWGDLLQQDPYYNPNLTTRGLGFQLAFPPRA